MRIAPTPTIVDTEGVRLQWQSAAPFFKKLEQIYSDMDNGYLAVAEQYRFDCKGCVDNCCRTLFYHHTLAEYFYLMKGMEGLPPPVITRVKDRSRVVCQKTAAGLKGSKSIRIWCPLNADGRCLLYRYRPMICRLHGIPHELHRPGTPVTRHPGCDAFSARREKIPYIMFNRTPFYAALAGLEGEIRRRFSFSKKLKMTVAEMLIA